MTPVGHKILVLPIKEDKSKGGIIIPESGQKNNKGKIIQIGTAVKQDWQGKTAIYHEHCGTEIDYNGKPHLILRCDKIDSDVIAVL